MQQCSSDQPQRKAHIYREAPCRTSPHFPWAPSRGYRAHEARWWAGAGAYATAVRLNTLLFQKPGTPCINRQRSPHRGKTGASLTLLLVLQTILCLLILVQLDQATKPAKPAKATCDQVPCPPPYLTGRGEALEHHQHSLHKAWTTETANMNIN